MPGHIITKPLHPGAARLTATLVAVVVVLIAAPVGSEVGGDTGLLPSTWQTGGTGHAAVADNRSDGAGQPTIAYSRNVGDTIWVIEASGGTPRQITTHRSGDPTWSPDGTQIAFTRYQGSTYDGVWVMDADGANPRRLTTGFSGGPDWSPDGVQIAFTSPRGIGVVNAETGASQQLTVNSDRDPAWSPDGSRIMFSRSERGVWVMGADGAKPTRIAIEARHPAWSPGSVRIAYTNHHMEGIFVMGANGAYKRQLTTDNGVFPQWAPDGTQIAYLGQRLDEIWSMEADGANRQQLASTGWDFVWSPDSQIIAFTRPDGIWVMDSDGDNPRQLTTHGSGPVWSPDGTHILYTSSHPDGVWLTDSEGDNRWQLTTHGSGPVWSPKGGHLAFTRPDGIWIIDSEGEHQLQLTDQYTEGPVWSPNGIQLAYTTRFGGTHVIDADGNNPRQLASDGTDPAWSPDGSQIAFVTTADQSLRTSDPEPSIHVIDVDGANRRLFTADGADPAWSPNGSQIAYTTRSGEIRVGRLNDPVHRSTNHYGDQPTWSPDGTHLAYVGSGGGIFITDSGGENHRTVTLERGLHPQWSPDGLRLAYHTTSGLAVVDAAGDNHRFLVDHGEKPSWRPGLGSAPTIHPLSQTSLSCPPDGGRHMPRFLPLTAALASPAPQTVSGPFEIEVAFSRPVSGFRPEELSVVNGRVTTFVDCGHRFRALVSPASVGAVTVRIPQNAAWDITGQGNFPSPILVRTGTSESTSQAWGIDTWDRTAVARSYTQEFRRTQPVMAHTGRIEDCLAGSNGRPFLDSVIQRINWYRTMAGLSEVAERVEFSEWAQQAALMMSAEGDLSHSPSPDWACHTTLGTTAAARSNLLLGAVGIEAVDGYMRNRGSDNLAVGHRRLLLHPRLREIGIGDTPGEGGRRSANALYLPEEGFWESPPRVRQPRGFVAWPPPGYVPNQAVWGRWSFSVPGADFSRASVTMTDHNGPVPVEILIRDSSFAGSRRIPDPAIIWAVAGDLDSTPLPTPTGGDHCFTVVITGVRVAGRIQTPYEYATCLFGS